MVVTRLPRAAASGVTHDRTGEPSTCTVQAPHSAMPQPNLVPVRPRSSRSTQRSGLSGSAATVTARPFTLKVVMSSYLPPRVPSPPSIGVPTSPQLAPAVDGAATTE